MLKKVIAAAVAVPVLATAALAEGACNYPKTAQTPAPVAAAPQTPAPTTDPVKVDVAEAPKPAQPKAN